MTFYSMRSSLAQSSHLAKQHRLLRLGAVSWISNLTTLAAIVAIIASRANRQA